MQSYGKTDVGLLRRDNEDSFRVSEGDGFVSAVVCDGMGGIKGGEVASELAVCVYTDTLFKEIGKSCDELTGQVIKSAMLAAVDEANRAVFARAKSNDTLFGMGTTLVACFVWGGQCFAVNVGDSRLYKVLNGKTTLVTKDHSFVQFLLDSGRITKKEAARHPDRNVITRAVGIAPQAEPDFFVVEKFDTLLLCSDGLVNYVSGRERDALMLSKASVKEKTEALIEAAKRGGGGDNVTVVLLQKEEDDG